MLNGGWWLQAGDETFRAISEFVEPKYIPVDYGGTLTCGTEPDSCRCKGIVL